MYSSGELSFQLGFLPCVSRDDDDYERGYFCVGRQFLGISPPAAAAAAAAAA